MQFAGAFGERGTRHTLTVAQGRGDLLRRQVHRLNFATLSTVNGRSSCSCIRDFLSSTARGAR